MLHVPYRSLYCGLVRLNWKVLRPATCMVLALPFLVAGCGGFSASQGVSPASFLLPGLLKADPPKAQPEQTLPADEQGTTVAQF